MKDRLRVLFLFAIYCGTMVRGWSAGNLLERIDGIAPRLDKEFFDAFIEKKHLQEAYALAQEEDFDLGNQVVIITQDMYAYTNKGRVLDSGKVKKILTELAAIEKEMQGLGAQEQTHVLQRWRYVFLNQLVDYVRYKNSLKPRWKLSLTSQTMYDSNVNKVPEVLGLPLDPSGKGDWQQMGMVNLLWTPFANSKNFPKGWSFEQSSNATRSTQVRHEESSVAIYDTESKLIRKFSSYLNSASLGYRVQHFMLSGDKTSRHPESSFLTHRIQTDFNGKPINLNWGNFVNTSSKASISWTGKDNFLAKNQKNDADEWKFGLGQSFKYKVGRALNSIGVDLEYDTYSTENNPSGEYDYTSWKITHGHSHKFSFFKNKFDFSEGGHYRMKGWDRFTSGIGGKKEEDYYGLFAKVSTTITGKLKTSLDLKHNWNEDQTRKGSTKADQFQVALGFNWSMP